MLKWQKYKNSLAGLIFLIPALLLFFQNCNNVNIQTPPAIDTASVASGIRGKFCLSNPNTGPNINGVSVPAGNFNTLLKIYLVPITSLPKNNLLVADSDMDGISDEKEDSTLASFGYISNNRRSKGIIDGICHKRYGNAVTSCAPSNCSVLKTYFYGSINNCDVDSFNGNAELKGLNMDAVTMNSQDYMPDLIEALRGTSIADVDVDGTTNSDQDLLDNEVEILQNSDPLVTTSSAANGAIIELVEESNSECGGQKAFSFTVPFMLTLPVQAYNDGTELSHDVNENEALIVVISSNLQGLKQYQSYLLKVPHANPNFGIEIKAQDFRFEGSY